VSQRGEAAFGVGQAQAAATELDFEHTIFFLQIRDRLLLVTLHSAGNPGDQDVENHSRSSG
jgi:hypothetical protein